MRRRGRQVAAIAVIAAGGLWAAGPELPAPVFPDDYSAVVLDRDGDVLRAYLADDEQWRLPLSREGLPEKLAGAVLTFEDQRFHQHWGVDPLAVARAVVGHLTGASRSGASTLTMQVSRLAIPKERTLWSKFVEVKHALALEWRYDKHEILRLWLTHTPYGGNLVGAEAASRRYFGCDPWNLSWGQAAFLASLPKSPNLTATAAGRKKLKRRRNLLLQRLQNRGLIDEKQSTLAQAEALPSYDFALPFVAPHASDRLRAENRASSVIQTTLDRELQSRAAAVAKTHARLLRERSVENLAALVVHNETGEVRAYIGSQDFHDDDAQGQVDGVVAPRSSGSILKPFLYALAMERGLMVPQTRLSDVPSHFGSFTPTNHDNRFSGEIEMSRALIESKNVPAVRVLADLGINDFHSLLVSAGFSTLFRTADDYGLALILGGAEVNLWDLAAAYRGLASGGTFEDISMLSTSTSGEARTPTPLLSRGVSLATLKVMRDLKRPGSEFYWQLFGNQRDIAWKTGTSYGHRDAWAVGVTSGWTVAVWAGNFSGEGRRDLWGSSSAAPMMFDLFALLPEQDAKSAAFDTDGDDFVHTDLCDETGLRATADCPHVSPTLTPRNRIPLASCQNHRRYFIEGDEGVCSLCWQEAAKSEVRLVKPAEVNAWLRSHGQSPQEPPKHRHTCPSAPAQDQVAVLQPTANATLLIPRVSDGEHGGVVMRAVHQRQDASLFWYLDGQYLGETTKRHQWTTVLRPGAHDLRIVDDRGVFQTRSFHAAWRNEG